MRPFATQRQGGTPGAVALALDLLGDFATSACLTASESDVRRTVATVRRFLFSSRIGDAVEITPETITAYLAEIRRQGRSDKTLANHRSAISRFCNFLVGRQILEKNPAGDVALRKPEELLPRYLNVDEIAVVLLTARAVGIWPEICLALSTGLRMSELARLCWTDVDLERRSLSVRKAKSRRPRTVPLSEAALQALRAAKRKSNSLAHVFPARQTWRGGGRLVDKPRNSSWWGRALRPIQDAVPKFRLAPARSTGRGWHLMRHTFASRAVQGGVSLYKLAAWMGHTDVRTTKIYAHLQAGYDEDIEAAGPLNGKTK